MKRLTFPGAILAVSALALTGIPGLAQAKEKQDKRQHQQEKQQRKDDHQQAKAQQQQERRAEQAVRRQQNAQRVDAQQARIQAQRQAGQINRAQARLPAARQRQLIQLQQARTRQYGARLAQQQRLADQRAALLQQQNRMAQYRYQQQYIARLRQQQSNLSSLRSYDYNSDPYFYTAPSYRYSRAGRTYETNQYGADLLRQAVSYGYEQGVRAGEADRQDRYQRGYQDSYAYQDASYGYTGMYVDQSDYNYYFRQGFQRGYQDGFGARSQFGQSNNGTLGILASVLSAILNLQALR
jgi:hypothetical protein